MKKSGDINRNQQQILRITEGKGTDHKARIWVLKCLNCLNIYGSNSTDAFERKCPKCQKGKAGLEFPVERDGKDWSHNEHILAFRLYNQIPFGSIHVKNPKIVELAAILGRKVGSPSLKLANFARLDPYHQARGVKGLNRGAKGEAAVWEEFAKDPDEFALRAETLFSTWTGLSVEEVAEIETDDLPNKGIERDAVIKVRVNQGFFRRRILSAYEFRCCVTGLTNKALLTASHIVPWAEDKWNRLNPRNGLCLNALHDRAFDRHLMWIDEDMIIRFSPSIRYQAKKSKEDLDPTEWLTCFDGKQLLLPEKFSPSLEFLTKHAAKCRAKQYRDY